LLLYVHSPFYERKLTWIGDLEALPAAFTLRRPPPISDDLSPLSDEIDALEPVRLGDEIPPWHRPADGYIDLEPDLDNLKEFEFDRRNASGTLWTHHLSPGRFCEALDEHEEDPVDESVPENPIIMETPVNRWLRKGKFKALDPFRLNANAPDTPMQVHAIVLETPYPAARIPHGLQTEEEVALEKEKTDWERECKRRKKLWRGLIGKDPGYGRFWDSLSRVSLLMSPYSTRVQANYIASLLSQFGWTGKYAQTARVQPLSEISDGHSPISS
jgi:hypothetical protein